MPVGRTEAAAAADTAAASRLASLQRSLRHGLRAARRSSLLVSCFLSLRKWVLKYDMAKSLIFLSMIVNAIFY